MSRSRAEPPLATPRGLRRTTFSAMGTEVTLLLPAGTEDGAELVRCLFATWQRDLSRFDPSSDLSRVNAAAGRAVAVGPLLVTVAREALRGAAATGGLFDPTLAADMVALGYDRTLEALPADGPPPDRRHLPRGAWREVELDEGRGTLRVPEGSGLDVGGIAKGMAVDAALAALAGLGIDTAAVDAGGDLAVSGLPAGSEAWTVALEGPLGYRHLGMRSGALATSSSGRRRWRRGGRWQHHLLDPRSGLPVANGTWAVSVLAASCRVAEVAAKAAFVLGMREGAAFLARMGLVGLLVDEHDQAVTAGAWGASGGVPASA